MASSHDPTREEVDQWQGRAVLEFGNSWCPHCQAAAPLFQQARASRPPVEHHSIADGPGQPLGRSYRVKLWPTFIFLEDGQEVARIVRPVSTEPLEEAFDKLGPGE